MKIILFMIAILGFQATKAMAAPVAGITSGISELKQFQLTQGKLALEDSGSGTKTIICVPGMGDTRGQYRELAPLLVKQGFRLIVIDPRGQGDSDASFDNYKASSVGNDLVALIDSLGVDVYLVGNSSGGASVAWAGAERPNKVKAIVFVDAFLRDHPLGFFQNIELHLALEGPWAVASWISYYKSLFTGNPPQDQNAYTDTLGESLHREGHVCALRSMVFASKDDVEARLQEVKQPVLALAGTKDPDFPNSEAEIDWILTQLKGEKAMIENAGHYPHLEYADQVARLITGFVNSH